MATSLNDLYLELYFLRDLVWQNAATKEHLRRLVEIDAEIARLERAVVDERWQARYGKRP